MRDGGAAAKSAGMRRTRVLGQRAPLLWLLLPWIVGLIAGRMTDLTRMGEATLLGVAAALGVVAIRQAPSGGWRWAAAVVGGLTCAGMVAYGVARDRLDEWETLPPREVGLDVRWERRFGVGRDARVVSGWGEVVDAPRHLRDLIGQRIHLSVRMGPEWRGRRPPVAAVVRVEGRLTRVERNPAPDSFAGYLAGQGINFSLSPGVVGEERRAPGAYATFCQRVAERLRVVLALGLEERPAEAAILRAMLLGEQEALTPRQKETFMRTGTLHVFSISGLHIGVIAVAIAGVLGLLRLGAWGTFMGSTALLWLYVDVTGRAPSAVRAFAMVALVQAAWVWRRPRAAVPALVASALVVLLAAPQQLFGASFQMSYGIVASLLMLGLPLGEAWQERIRPWTLVPPETWTWLQRAAVAAARGLAASLAIGVATAPVSLLAGVVYFRLLTLGAVAANLVVVPLASLALLAGFASMVSGLMGLESASVLFNHGAALVLAVMERLLVLAEGWPGMHRPASFGDARLGFLALGVVLASLLVGFHHGWDARRGGFWPPFGFAALVLIWLVIRGPAG